MIRVSIMYTRAHVHFLFAEASRQYHARCGGDLAAMLAGYVWAVSGTNMSRSSDVLAPIGSASGGGRRYIGHPGYFRNHKR